MHTALGMTGFFAALIRDAAHMAHPCGVVCFILLPRVGSQYVSYLVLTFFGYGVALLGLNLLFGYTGLLSFRSRPLLATGAYTVSYIRPSSPFSRWSSASSWQVIVAGRYRGVDRAICVRYIKIYFALLMLAFGMLMYSSSSSSIS